MEKSVKHPYRLVSESNATEMANARAATLNLMMAVLVTAIVLLIGLFLCNAAYDLCLEMNRYSVIDFIEIIGGSFSTIPNRFG